MVTGHYVTSDLEREAGTDPGGAGLSVPTRSSTSRPETDFVTVGLLRRD